jgi:hypothetical protein
MCRRRHLQIPLPIFFRTGLNLDAFAILLDGELSAQVIVVNYGVIRF